jgi:hypothetical protein
MRRRARALTGVGLLLGMVLLMPRCSGGGCTAGNTAGRGEADELGVAVPPAAASALGAYARAQRTPINRVIAPVKVRDGGARKKPRRPITPDAGVPL